MSVTETSAGGPVPSERDWNVYQFVRVQQWSTRATAKEFGISQTLVGQIVQRLGRLIVQSIKVPTKELAARQLAAGRQLAAERIDFLVKEAICCFRKSQSSVKSTHDASGSLRCRSTRTSHGDIRYLNAAARLTLIASTLPPPLVIVDAADFDETDVEETDAEEAEPSVADDHPEEACSEPVAEQGAVAGSAAEELSATAAAIVSCVEQSRPESPRSQGAARPVQTTQSPVDAKARRRAQFFQTG